MTSLKFIGSY